MKAPQPKRDPAARPAIQRHVVPPRAAQEHEPEAETPADSDAEFNRALVWIGGGGALTAITYAFASSGNGGGTYLIAWG